ncbi:MAG TPA: nuclear transport factor 2 family protein [Nocardioidaceae bacterium]|nr:nuclear transport factor 2 family protein [Nocardioidaceae bacterium]
MPTSRTEVVRAAFDAYRTQDREAADRLMAEELAFTSPQDDHIDKAAYLERCFPTADRLVSQEVIELVEAGDDGVFILYEYELKTGERHRNSEFITVRDGRIVEIQVFFGGRV